MGIQFYLSYKQNVFVIQSYMKTFMKLKLKKEKISDVQKALQSGSGEIEFKDFRETLKG